jgi:hypothetical protein
VLFYKCTISLEYSIQLEEALNIPIDIEKILYFRCSGLTSEDIQTAKEVILSTHNDQEAYLDLLVKNEPWRQAFALNYPQEFEDAENLKAKAFLRDNLEPADYVEIEQHFFYRLKALSKRALLAQKSTTV